MERGPDRGGTQTRTNFDANGRPESAGRRTRPFSMNWGVVSAGEAVQLGAPAKSANGGDGGGAETGGAPVHVAVGGGGGGGGGAPAVRGPSSARCLKHKNPSGVTRGVKVQVCCRCAKERTRTSTGVTPLEPESSASAYPATRAVPLKRASGISAPGPSVKAASTRNFFILPHLVQQPRNLKRPAICWQFQVIVELDPGGMGIASAERSPCPPAVRTRPARGSRSSN